MGPLNIDIWRQHIDNVPQDEISRYVAVSIFWHTPSRHESTFLIMPEAPLTHQSGVFEELVAGLEGHLL